MGCQVIWSYGGKATTPRCKAGKVRTNMTLKERIESRLGASEYVFDPAEMGTITISEKAKVGLIPVCPRCGARLEFALNANEALSKRIHPGVRCTKRPNHFEIIVELASNVLQD